MFFFNSLWMRWINQRATLDLAQIPNLFTWKPYVAWLQAQLSSNPVSRRLVTAWNRKHNIIKPCLIHKSHWINPNTVPCLDVPVLLIAMWVRQNYNVLLGKGEVPFCAFSRLHWIKLQEQLRSCNSYKNDYYHKSSK